MLEGGRATRFTPSRETPVFMLKLFGCAIGKRRDTKGDGGVERIKLIHKHHIVYKNLKACFPYRRGFVGDIVQGQELKE